MPRYDNRDRGTRHGLDGVYAGLNGRCASPAGGLRNSQFLSRPVPGRCLARLPEQVKVFEMVYPRRQGAQGVVEFGLIIALVAVVAITGLLLFGGTVTQMMSSLSHTV